MTLFQNVRRIPVLDKKRPQSVCQPPPICHRRVGGRLLCAGLVVCLAHTVLAGILYVPNFSFESPTTPFADPRVDSWQKAPQPPTFDSATSGAWTNLAGEFLNPSQGNPERINNADGNQLAFLFNYPQVALFQDYSSTDWSNALPTHAFNAKFTPGHAYRLTVGITSSSEEPLTPGATLQAALYYRDASSNMVTVAATNITYDPLLFTNLNQLIDFSASVPAVRTGDLWAGRNIGILFLSTVAPNLIGGVWDLDNVRLMETVADALSQPGRANGQFSFTLRSEPGLVFQILATTNLSQFTSNWPSIATLTNTTGSNLFTDGATNYQKRFYRARELP